MKSKILIFILLPCININYLFAQTWQSFTAANSGLPDNMVNSITISSDGIVWFATDAGLASYKDNIWNVFKTDDGLSSNKLNFVSFLPLDSNKLWAASNSGATILNVNSNSSVSDPEYITKANNNIVSDTVTVIAMDGFLSNWIGTDKGLSVITNSGIYNFTQENGFESGKVNSLRSLSDNWVHIGTSGGGVKRLKYNGVDGITAASEIITTWSGLASDSVLTIYVTNNGVRWYGTTEGVSTHFGEDTKDINNWGRYNTQTSGIIDNYVRAIISDNYGDMWFGTRKGLSKLSAEESSWQSFTEQDGLISNNIFDLEVDSDNNLWIATDKGVSYLITQPTSVHQKEKIDYQIKLANYPNPFNPVTKIDYTIPKSGKVKLEVFDNLGSLIKVLVDKTQNAGNYQVLFGGDNIPSGIYLYRLTTERSSITKKMVLIR
ncbi:MAG: two-component regulator propeller domain-containing protein [Ignavibacteria bacterium]